MAAAQRARLFLYPPLPPLRSLSTDRLYFTRQLDFFLSDVSKRVRIDDRNLSPVNFDHRSSYRFLTLFHRYRNAITRRGKWRS